MLVHSPFPSLLLFLPRPNIFFILRNPIMIALVYPCCYRDEHILPYAHIVQVYASPPLIGRIPLSRSLLILIPPVFFVFIYSYLYHSHPWKMGSRHHIGKRCIFVGRRDCRSASVLRHWDSVLFFAYPLGGANLLILIFYH